MTTYRESEWMESALCAQVDADMFSIDQGGSNRAAKRVCQMCPVIAECLEYAMGLPTYREYQSVMAGLTPDALRAERRRRDRENPEVAAA